MFAVPEKISRAHVEDGRAGVRPELSLDRTHAPEAPRETADAVQGRGHDLRIEAGGVHAFSLHGT